MTDTLPEQRPAPPPPPSTRLPEILGPWETLVVFWRWLRRMSTALLLLFALAVGSVIGTFIPQEPVIATTVAQWRDGSAGPGETVSRVFDALGFFDVFGSWWFLGITALLFVSLTGCLIPRIRGFARTARRPPPRGRGLAGLTNSVLVPTTLAPAEALDAAERTLRRRRYRVRRITDADGRTVQLAAERGHWREGGSLVFHLAFYLLLIGVVIAQGFGFTGQVNVVEGDPPIVDTRLTYGLSTPGRWFGMEDHRGFAIRLDEFTVDYHDNDTPAEFRSDISILEAGQVVNAGPVRVNHPFRHDGMNIYQIRFGMAPRVVVRAGEQEIFNERVAMSQEGGVWTGVAKVSTRDGNQVALDLVLVPDADVALDADGQPQIVNRSPEPENPTVFASLYVGELGLERPVPASEFDRSGGAAAELVLPPGTPQDVLGDLTVEFADLGEWSGFQVSHQPGRPVLLAGAALVLIGLVPSLYSYRRRLWVEPEDGGLRMAGVALQRQPCFTEAFADLRDAVARRVGGPADDPAFDPADDRRGTEGPPTSDRS